jgi:hypothetical protein
MLQRLGLTRPQPVAVHELANIRQQWPESTLSAGGFSGAPSAFGFGLTASNPTLSAHLSTMRPVS